MAISKIRLLLGCFVSRVTFLALTWEQGGTSSTALPAPWRMVAYVLEAGALSLAELCTLAHAGWWSTAGSGGGGTKVLPTVAQLAYVEGEADVVLDTGGGDSDAKAKKEEVGIREHSQRRREADIDTPGQPRQQAEL